ncbi:MAG: diaminopimelate decarboxylase [Candidatus Nanopelagicaceae bacterium]|nr:diaminopimelate decarboxylase [Candidatus Nanopelagicaceae bacterium]
MTIKFNPKIWPSTTSEKSGVISVGGCTLTSLAREFGTPAFILDEADFKSRAQEWKSALDKHFGTNAGTAYYAAKAFISKEIVHWVEQSGLGLDVCTGGELAVAKAARFPAERMELHGNNKSEVEIADAIDYRVGTIVVDSLQEIERVAKIAHNKGVVQKILLRLTPGVDAHTHEAISTAHEDVKFGFSIASGAAWDAVLATLKHESLSLRGFHAHIGSQIFVSDAFETSAGRLIDMLSKFKTQFGVELPELDLGGGYGIAYIDSDNPSDAQQILEKLSAAVAKECRKNNLSVPKISIEPGRAIVGPSMITLYEVGTTKEVVLEDGSKRWYISVDGGMSDNLRTALYDAEYSINLVNRSSSAPLRLARVVGKHCETGDIVINDVQLPSDIVPGDLLATPATGAYGRSMANNYNHMTRPPVISVMNQTARTIIRRENYADLLALEVEEHPRRISE